MKKIKYSIVLWALLVSCSNQDITHPDYAYKAVYFPLQYPLRTLVLGESRSDNSLDKKLQFHIGVSIGGMYENNSPWDVGYVMDTSLAPSNLTNAAGDSIKVLPSSYYTLSPLNKVTIPAGSFNGLVLVQLTDAFLDDPLAVTGQYVIPLRITSTTADSILTGVPFVPDADRNIPGDWDPGAEPKDFVLFGIKYINPYHGNYFHRGIDIGLSPTGDTVSSVTYHEQYVVNDQLWKLTTTGRNTVKTNGIGSQLSGDTHLLLNINDKNTIQIHSEASSSFDAKGIGKYVRDAELWSGMKHDAMYLNYIYKDGAINHVVSDTLVYRDNGVAFEQFTVIVN